MNAKELAAAWLEAKAIEEDAVENRRKIEDDLSSLLAVDLQSDKQMTAKVEGFSVKVTCRLNRKVDANLLQEIAHEHGLTEQLSSLFRWKPEINAKEWKAAAPDITRPLEAAITTTAGRPSYSITKEDVNNG